MRVKWFVPSLVMVITAVLLVILVGPPTVSVAGTKSAKPAAKPKAKTAKTHYIDFWYVKKGSVNVPSGWCSSWGTYESSYLDIYLMSKTTDISPSKIDGPIQGNIRITSVELNDIDTHQSALGDIPAKWSKSIQNTIGSKPNIKIDNIVFSRAVGGTYIAKRYRYSDDNWKTDLIVCGGQKTKYSEGRYKGLDVYPVYVVEIEWPSGKSPGRDDINAMVKSLKLP